MKTMAVIQARMESNRLPGKTMMPILGKPMLWHIVRRVQRVPGVADVVVATSNEKADEPIRQFCWQNGIRVFAGSETDALDRFYQTAARFWADPVIRVTGDCPFVDPEMIERLLDLYKTGSYDYVSIATGAGPAFLSGGRFPDGLNAECLSFAALKRAWEETTEASDREQVTPYLWHVPGRFRVGMLKADRDYSDQRWTVDNEADFELVSRIYKALYSETRQFLMQDVLDYLSGHPRFASSSSLPTKQECDQDLWSPNLREAA